MLAHLSSLLITPSGQQPWTLQAIITKADTIPSDDVAEAIKKLRKDIFEAAPLCLPPIITSTQMNPMFGIDEVRKSIVDACGLKEVVL